MFFQRPLFWSSLIFICGIAGGYYFTEYYLFIILLFLFFIVFFSWRADNFYIIPVIIIITLCGFFLMLNMESRYYSEESIIHWNDKGLYIVKGEVIENLASLTGKYIYLKPEKINGQGVKYGLIQLNKDYLPVDFRNGEVISLKLKLKTPEPARNPGNFSYKNYLKKKGIYSIGYCDFCSDKNYIIHYSNPHVIKNNLINYKNRLIYLIDISLKKPFNEIIKALVLGERENLPSEWEENFAEAGASHLLAISGLHVGFIMLIFVFIFQLSGIDGIIGNVLCTVFMVFYILISGMRASVLRAGLLTIFFLWAPFWERRADIFNICGLTIIITLVINPYQLFTAGFQLTYLVLFMIILWADIIKNTVNKIIAVSTAAQLGSIPITAYYFNMITPAGILTNIWAIPLVAVLILIAIIGLLSGLIHPVFAVVSGMLINNLLKIIYKGIFLMSEIPGGYLEVPTPPVSLIIISYIFLFSIPIIIKRYILPVKISVKKYSTLFISIILILSTFIWMLLPFFCNNFKITFLFVGQGDSILMKTPDEKYMLVDGGDRDGSKYVLSYLKAKGIKKIDIIFITHFDMDHAGGIPAILKEKQVGLLILPDKIPGTFRPEIAAKITELVKAKNISLKYAGRGDVLKYKDLTLKILNPIINSGLSGTNNNSLVMKVNFKKISALLTGDLEYEGEISLLKCDFNLKSQIIKLGHHGSNSSSSSIFLKNVSPLAAIISVGENNYGHPDQEVIKKTKNSGIEIYRTDKDGAVTVTTDGENYFIESYLN